MKSKFQRDGLLTIVVVAALSGAFLFFFYLPERKAAQDLRAEITQLQASIKRVPIRVAELESLKREIALREDFLKKSRAWMPAKADVPAVLEQVSRLADGANLKVTRLEPKTAERAHSYHSIPFRVTFRGRFSGIAGFLRGLENHERTVTFEELTLKHDQEDRQQTSQADLHFSVYADGSEFNDSAGINDSGNESVADTRIR